MHRCFRLRQTNENRMGMTDPCNKNSGKEETVIKIAQ